MAAMYSGQIWVAADIRNERFFSYTLNLLGGAAKLAGLTGKAPAAFVIAGDSLCQQTDEAVGALSAHGASTVYTVYDESLAVPQADAYARALAQAAKKEKPSVILFSLTDFGRQWAAMTAAHLNAGLVADCADFSLEDGRIVASCPSWGGRILAKITWADAKVPACATVSPGAFKPLPASNKIGRIVQLKLEGVFATPGLELVSRQAAQADEKSLEQAQVVVAGGAGAGGAEGFFLLRELAQALGGQLGATRPPVLAHLVDEGRLIGQTGKTVRPQLLISVGASGAIQYTAGIVESGLIVAVNRDKEAPIFEVADVGIVADAKTFLPVFTQKVKAAVMQDLAQKACFDQEGQGGKEGLGQAVARLREAHGFTLESLAQATGQSPEFLNQVERGETSPSVSFILRLARALKVDPATFLGQQEKTALADNRAKAFIKRTQNYSYQTLTPGAEEEHLRAFLITIEPRCAHKPLAYKHEGEEFVFVMEGELELTLGGKPNRLKPGESLRFNSEIPHKLRSLSDGETRCLVVLYTP
jgi:electron transfer flavoprotein alpha subunit/transcriptional regulator with XRE-family HTH domain